MKPYFETKNGQLYHGDCLDVMKQLDIKADLCLTDPPYEFISKSPVGGGIYKNKNKRHLDKIKSSFGMSFDPTLFLAACCRVMPSTHAYIWTNKNLLKDYIQFAEENALKWEIIIWSKTNPVPAYKGHYMIDKEYCLYIKKSGMFFNSTLNYQQYKTVFTYPLGIKDTKHPTEKPKHIISNMIEVSTLENNLVLDPFFGSGTTGVACELLGRRWIGIELDEEYCEIAAKRIEKASKQHQLFDGEKNNDRL